MTWRHTEEVNKAHLIRLTLRQKCTRGSIFQNTWAMRGSLGPNVVEKKLPGADEFPVRIRRNKQAVTSKYAVFYIVKSKVVPINAIRHFCEERVAGKSSGWYANAGRPVNYQYVIQIQEEGEFFVG